MIPAKIECFGIVPLTFLKGVWRVFLVQHLNGGHWGFPKGHGEKGESPKETAERELREETGMEVIDYLSHIPPLMQTYQYRDKEGHLIDKTVHFYLAEVTSEYSVQSEEIIQGKWMALEDLFSYVTFPKERKLYRALIEAIG